MEIRHYILKSTHANRPFGLDLRFISGGNPKPLILFLHGFKGFKDWGPFDAMASAFASEGFIFAKMNFSHNGTTPEHPTEFVDLQAFANNNFCIELDDAGAALDFLLSSPPGFPQDELDKRQLYIMGHSRGGTSALLKAAEDSRLKAVAAWASPNNLSAWHSPEEIEYWAKTGTIYVLNSRTGQQMPMHFQIVENYRGNRDRLDVPAAVRRLKVPVLALHGSADASVPSRSSAEMKSWNAGVRLEIIEGADHTFGATNPWKEPSLPAAFEWAVRRTAGFFHSCPGSGGEEISTLD